MEIGRWGGRKFVVQSNLIRGFTGLTIKGSTETKDKTTDKQKFVERKNSNPTQVSMTVVLDGRFGIGVQEEALWFVEAAYNGKSDYMYINGEKLLPYQLMLTDAEVSETKLTPAAEWLSAQVKLTMKQCSKADVANGGTSGGPAAAGVYVPTDLIAARQQTSTLKIITGTKPLVDQSIKETLVPIKLPDDVDTVTSAQPASTAKNWAQQMVNLVNNAKTTSATTNKVTPLGTPAVSTGVLATTTPASSMTKVNTTATTTTAAKTTFVFAPEKATTTTTTSTSSGSGWVWR